MSWPTQKKVKRAGIVAAALLGLAQVLNVQVDPQAVNLLSEVFKLFASW